jgi:hypothetical protein
MKLSKVTSNDPVGRQAISFHQSTTRQLQAYRAYYQSVHGDEISLSQLVEEIAKRFLREDREFHKWLTKNPNAGAEAAKAGK